MSSDNNTKTHHIDYLDVDPELRGQNYFCVSFVEPPVDRFAHKESFLMSKFINQYGQILYLQFCKKHDIKPDSNFTWDNSELYDRYIDFKTIDYQKLCDEYEKQENNATHMRLFKVRGVFNKYDDAVSRCKMLQTMYPTDQISVSEVGKWGPYAPPNFNDIKDIVYTEEKMQQFMKEILENEDAKQAIEKKRKAMMISSIEKDHQDNLPVILDPIEKAQDDNISSSSSSSSTEAGDTILFSESNDTPPHISGEINMESAGTQPGQSVSGTGVSTEFPYN